MSCNEQHLQAYTHWQSAVYARKMFGPGHILASAFQAAATFLVIITERRDAGHCRHCDDASWCVVIKYAAIYCWYCGDNIQLADTQSVSRLVSCRHMTILLLLSDTHIASSDGLCGGRNAEAMKKDELMFGWWPRSRRCHILSTFDLGLQMSEGRDHIKREKNTF